MDHYSILGISRDANIDVIKTAYRKLALKHHPDQGGELSKFQVIQEAYKSLTDVDIVLEDIYYDLPLTIGQIYNAHECIIKYERMVDGAKTMSQVVFKKSKGMLEKTFIFSGKGHKYRGLRSNLIVNIVYQDDEYIIDGYDLIKQIDIPIVDAWYGFTLHITTIDKQVLTLKFNSLVEDDSHYILEGYGLPKNIHACDKCVNCGYCGNCNKCVNCSNCNKCGNLIINIHLKQPTKEWLLENKKSIQELFCYTQPSLSSITPHKFIEINTDNQ